MLLANLEHLVRRVSLQGLGRCVAPRAVRRQCSGLGGLRPFTTSGGGAARGGAASASALADAPFPATAPTEAADGTPAAVAAEQQQEQAPTYRAAIDFKFVRDNLELVARNCVERAAAADPARVVALYEEFVRLQQETDAVRAARNENSTAMKMGGGGVGGAGGWGRRADSEERTWACCLREILLPCCRCCYCFRLCSSCCDAAAAPVPSNAATPLPCRSQHPHPTPQPRRGTPPPAQGKLDPERRQQLIAHGKALKEQLESLEAALAGVEEALQREGQRLPNLSHPAAPVGGEEAAAVVREVGQRRAFEAEGFAPRDHVALGEELDLIDWDAGAAVSSHLAGVHFFLGFDLIVFAQLGS